MLKPIYKMKLRRSGKKYSIGIPKEIAEQIVNTDLELTVEKGKIQIVEGTK